MKHEKISRVISEQSECVLLRAKANNAIYATVNGYQFENLTSGTCGVIDKETATRIFTIPLRLNSMQQKNPLLKELIIKLGLAIEQ